MTYYRLRNYVKWQFEKRAKGRARWAAVDTDIFSDPRVHGLTESQQFGWICVILLAKLCDNRIPSSVGGKPPDAWARQKLGLPARKAGGSGHWSIRLYVDLGLLEEFSEAGAVASEAVEAKPKQAPLKIVPQPKPKAPRADFVAKAGEVWQKYKGTPNWGRLGKALKPYRDGTEERDELILQTLEKYLIAGTAKPEEVKYLTPENFAGQFVALSRHASKPQAQHPPVTSRAQREADAAMIIAKLEALNGEATA